MSRLRTPASSLAFRLVSAAALFCSVSTAALARASDADVDADTTRVSDVTIAPPADQNPDRDVLGKPKVLTTTTDADVLRDRMVDSIADFARRVDAGVNFNSDNQSINIRGLDANRVLTTVDGIRVPWLNDGARGVEGGVAAFDFNSLSAIDVVKTTDSSVFGAGAMGGVLAVRTLDPEDILVDGKTFGGLSKLTYDSASDGKFVNQALASRVGDTLFLVQGGYASGSETHNQGEVEGTGATRTARNPADYEQKNLLIKARHYFAGGHRLGLSGELFDRQYDEDTLTSVGSTYSAYATSTENKRKRLAATYDYQAEGDGPITEAHLTGYWQQLNLRTDTQAMRKTAPIGEYDRDSDLQEDSYGLNGSLTARLQTGALQHVVTVAGDVAATKTQQYAAGVDNCTSAIYSCSFLHVNQSDMPDVDGVDLGLVIQDRISLGDLRVTPGLRFDHYSRDPKETASYTANAAYEGLPGKSDDSHGSPKLLVEYDLKPNLTLFGQYSQAFRAPSATELYLTYGGSGSYVSIGNPDLKPETSKGYELGVRYGDRDRGARFSVYDNHYRNFIDTVTTTAAAAGLSGSYPYGVFKYVNLDRVHIWGVEASGQWRLTPQWRVWGSAAYAQGKDTDADTYLNSVAPLRAVVGVGYSQAQWGGDLSLTAAAKRDKVQNEASDLNKAPAYQVVDLMAWYAPAALNGVRLQAGVYNLLDKTYYNALDIPDSATLSKAYYAQPGRTVKASVIYKF